jgi:hypothetical protein
MEMSWTETFELLGLNLLVGLLLGMVVLDALDHLLQHAWHKLRG